MDTNPIKKKALLIIKDNYITKKLCEITLAKMNYEVESLGWENDWPEQWQDSPKIVSEVVEFYPDLIVCDLHSFYPDIASHEYILDFLQKVRTAFEQSKYPFNLIIAHPDASLPQKYKHLINNTLIHPFDIEDFVQVVDDFLK